MLIEISIHLIACISKALTSQCGGLLQFLYQGHFWLISNKYCNAFHFNIKKSPLTLVKCFESQRIKYYINTSHYYHFAISPQKDITKGKDKGTIPASPLEQMMLADAKDKVNLSAYSAAQGSASTQEMCLQQHHQLGNHAQLPGFD